MTRFVCWLWRGRGFWNAVARYEAEHVRVLASMLGRHGGHRLTCVHDGSFEMPAGVKSIVMPRDVAALPDYQPKIWAWSPEFHQLIGERFASIDLDTVILGDLAPVVETDAPIRLWGDAMGEPYNTSLFTVEPGFGNAVWDRYSPEALERARGRAARWTGDQSWVAHVLGPNMPALSHEGSLLRYAQRRNRQGVPIGTRAVFFCGPFCPRTESDHSRWVRQNWC